MTLRHFEPGIHRQDLREADLIVKCQAGDAYAFELLYKIHRHRVYSLCLRMVKNVAEAEELTQEAFLQVFRKISTFRSEASFSTWLHRLTFNVVLGHLRKKRFNEVSLDQPIGEDAQTFDSRPYRSDDLGLMSAVDRVVLDKAIRRLPLGYRTILILHDIEGYQHDEIAQIIGCSIGNSKSQLHKARLKLRDMLLGRKKAEPKAAIAALQTCQS